MRIFVTGLILAAAMVGARAEEGIASHYSTRDKDQNGTTTACGPKLQDNGPPTVAHKTLKCGSVVTITNKDNGRSVSAIVTDRGPFVRGRIVDLNLSAARAIGLRGLARVSVH